MKMKTIQRAIQCFFLLSISLGAFAQQEWNAAGVWAGRLYNDSTKKFIPFEIAISYHNSKYAGYTYTVFMIDSIENIGVKDVTIKEKSGLFIIKDKKLIDNNYKDAPAKGVYTTLELQHTENDTADILSGTWFTNKTKEYYPLSGTVSVTRRKNIFATRIVPKLRQLGLADDLSFFSYSYNIAHNETKKEIKPVEKKGTKDSMMTIVEPELVITVPKSKEIKIPNANALKNAVDSAGPGTKNDMADNQKINNTKPDNKTIVPKTIEKPLIKNVEPEIVKTKPFIQPKQEKINASNEVSKDTVVNKVVAIKKVSDDQITKTKPNPSTQKPVEVVVTKTENNLQKNTATPERSPALIEKIIQKKDTLTINTSQLDKPLQKVIPVKIDLSDRKIETIRTVPIQGDSLVLSLFDNGAVDGDTVSVLLNGQVVVSKVGLLEKAFNQTIHLTPDMGDSIKIVLYAENLGSIPPNTGLLVVRNDGKDYEIRFSGDLKQNSAIILLRNR